ncbi:MAG TPA: hypothetical protein VFJ72_12570 [Rubrobacteraceae bacterium]|nr:hypothetical protein [Rubrobacteraceae bacterium]
MDDLAERGFTGVLHTFSENDLYYYRDQMRRIVEVSHAAGLEVQINPWAVGHAFGGESESLFTASHPEVGQIFDDVTPVGAACPNHPAFRAFVRSWADAAIETGADRVFWDEPHWADPSRFGVSTDRWACRCERCRGAFFEQYGERMPHEMTPEVAAFREASLVGFVRELVAHVETRGSRSTVCLLPLTEGPLGLSDWSEVARMPGLDTLATDPYWKTFGHPARDFVGGFASRVRDLGAEHGVSAQVWIQGFGLGPEDGDDLHAAVQAARSAGVEDLWTWGYEACGHMTHLGTREPERVWATLTEALTGYQSG